MYCHCFTLKRNEKSYINKCKPECQTTPQAKQVYNEFNETELKLKISKFGNALVKNNLFINYSQ